ncbi:uncharacterized protein LOC142785395 [Rhipicephalus microplus]|uniref:uncharacterized protein LOC142785395 n=1 Tax=Rhipicephalus microplus TaxID=6941 RepID=UPI003F6D988C
MLSAILHILVSLLLMATLGNECEVDPKEALFSAAKIGRATHHFFRNCSRDIQKLKPNPSPELTNKFIRSLCDLTDVCQGRFPNLPFNETVPCIQEAAWTQWIRLA